jgi:hypothetical protein
MLGTGGQTMSKADKRKIEELQDEVRRERDKVSSWQTNYFGLKKTVDELRIELLQERENYAQLLERYISMMERTVRLNEQREAD